MRKHKIEMNKQEQAAFGRTFGGDKKVGLTSRYVNSEAPRPLTDDLTAVTLIVRQHHDAIAALSFSAHKSPSFQPCCECQCMLGVERNSILNRRFETSSKHSLRSTVHRGRLNSDIMFVTDREVA